MALRRKKRSAAGAAHEEISAVRYVPIIGLGDCARCCKAVDKDQRRRRKLPCGCNELFCEPCVAKSDHKEWCANISRYCPDHPARR